MKTIITKLTLIIAFLFTSLSYGQQSIQPEDLNILVGDWEGSLTYMDYSTNAPYTMPVNLLVEKGKNEYQLLLSVTYPNEPKANSTDKIKISKDGAQINKVAITSIDNISEGETQITTTYTGKDANKKAKIRNVYIVSETTFVIRKEVQFVDTKDWLLRNEYTYSR